MDIKDYIKRKNQKESQNQNAEQAYQNYMQMSQEQLMDEMFRTASAARAAGTLNEEMLDKFYLQAQSFLSPEQAERMRELIIQLKR